MGFGWGTILGMLADRVPSREESIRTNIQKLERKRDEILKEPKTKDSERRLNAVLDKLKLHRKKLENR